jgi:hypothetical protein
MVERKNSEQEKDDNYTRIKAAGHDEQYLDLTSGKEPAADLSPKQQTCTTCGLTARNKEELQDHINNAHTEK